MNFKARYQAMKNRQGNDWWTITFGDPISWIVLGVIGDVKWIIHGLPIKKVMSHYLHSFVFNNIMRLCK